MSLTKTAMTPNRDGRILLLWLLGTGCFIIVTLFVTFGYEKTWRLWNIHTMMPYLIDSRVITAGAEAHAHGYDPLIENPGFTNMNYPRIWQLLFNLGIDQSDTIYFGLVFAVLFFSGVFLIAENISRRTALLMTCAVFSPAVLFGLERGNTDLFIFFLLALSIYLVKKTRVGTAIVIGFAFLLKLYPVFALAIFLRERKRLFWTILVSSIIVCCVYVAVMFDELRLIRLATPKPQASAYGIDVAWQNALNHHLLHASLAIHIVSYIAVVFAGAFSLFHAGRFGSAEGDDNSHIDSFRVGAATYVGTFLIGGNWDYRLMFLLLVIPQLHSWRRSSSRYVRQIGITTLVCVILSLWSLLILKPLVHLITVHFLLDQFSKWVVFLGLLYLFIYSLPDWLKLWVRPGMSNMRDDCSVAESCPGGN